MSAAPLFVPYFLSSSSLGEVNLTFNQLIRDRKASYISMGQVLYSSGSEKGIVYTNFYGSSPEWSNNAIAMASKDASSLAHLVNTKMIRWSGRIQGVRAVHLRTKVPKIPDREVEAVLREMGVKGTERKILPVSDHYSTIAFDMDAGKVYEFPLEKRGRVLHEF